MLRHPIYTVYGLFLVGLVGVAEYNGWRLLPTNQVRSGPKSIRDNPGASRPHYGAYRRYSGGK
jgi:hypothetical protein